MPEPLLEIRDLTVSFRTESGVVHAVDGLSLSLGLGEVVGIVGESGSGKTVSMMAVMRLIRDPNAVIEGEVLHRGRDLLKLSQREMRQVRGGEIAMIFQDPMTALTPVYTVGWQIAEQLRAHEDLTKKQARRRTVELLAEVGISNPERRIDDYPHQFSGGMRQRVMIAMALSCNPSLLIADEPTTALDVTIQAQILELMKRLQRDYGSSILLITHDMGVVSEIAERVVVMYAGSVVEEGPEGGGLPRPAAPVHVGPARLDSSCRHARAAARGDPGLAAVAACATRRMSFRAALPASLRALLGPAGARRAGRARSRRRLPSRPGGAAGASRGVGGMSVARLRLAPVGETMFPPRCPLLPCWWGNLPVPHTPSPLIVHRRMAYERNSARGRCPDQVLPGALRCAPARPE